MSRSSPHLPVRASVPVVMRRVCLALLPGIALCTALFGPGVLVNLLLCSGAAMITEGLLIRLRQRDVRRALGDYSALLSGLLLGLAIPAWAPWWLPVLGGLFAMSLGKQLYGGLGYNPFNPAMLGYVVLLISFPTEMSLWLNPGADQATLWNYLAGALQPGQLDGITAATPLDQLKTELGRELTLSEASASLQPGLLAAANWDLINLAFLAGGLYLLATGTIRWQIPVGLLGGLALISLLFNAADPDHYAGLLHHLFGGATMLGAFFIATDPVSASTTPRGRLIYGAGIGALTWLIRTYGGYPDGIAFAVLLMNICVPMIDRATPPRTFGHNK